VKALRKNLYSTDKEELDGDPKKKRSEGKSSINGQSSVREL
jgi:hypothetical protein